MKMQVGMVDHCGKFAGLSRFFLTALSLSFHPRWSLVCSTDFGKELNSLCSLLSEFTSDRLSAVELHLPGVYFLKGMGIYLSTPKTDKFSEDGENERIRYGLSSMQGWRATMEDAHAVIPDLDSSTSFFGVYDGHGGKVQNQSLTTSKVLTNWSSWYRQVH